MIRGSLATRFGTLDVACSVAGVASCAWRAPRSKPAWPAPDDRGAGGSDTAADLCAETLAQLRAYFAGRLARFDVPLVLRGTAFEGAVWNCVGALHVGERVSYADVARAVGRPRSHRGVARAMSHAPFDVLIPAQRVVGADGRVRGAGPDSMRVRLLAFEDAVVQRRSLQRA